MAAEPVIEVENLTKYYGDFPAISDVSFTVDKGEILGFLGPNGAGKSTTMKILTGYMPPTEGVVRIAGYDVVSQSLEARKRMGYLPETVPLYTDMTVRGYLGSWALFVGCRETASAGARATWWISAVWVTTRTR